MLFFLSRVIVIGAKDYLKKSSSDLLISNSLSNVVSILRGFLFLLVLG